MITNLEKLLQSKNENINESVDKTLLKLRYIPIMMFLNLFQNP